MTAGSSSAADDERWMRLALAEAQAAAAAGEVPVGAVVVHQGRLIATGRNNPIGAHDPTGHAEVNALRAAAAALGNYRLDDCELFVTLEPCAMCSGAMLHARVARVVYGAADPRTGAAGSVLDVFGHAALNHHTQVQGGVLATECSRALQDFFQGRRAQARVVAQPLRDDALRTPESRFRDFIPAASLHQVSDLPALDGLRLAWLDSGVQIDAVSDDASPVVCLHGPGQWGHLYRHLWPLVGARRLLVPDLIGHGRSDKPKRPDWHWTERHAQVLDQWMTHLRLAPVTLVYHPRLEAVAQALLASDRKPVAAMLPVPAQFLTHAAGADDAGGAGWLRAPFPDRGHEAALRAWGLRRVPEEDLDVANAAKLATVLYTMGANPDEGAAPASSGTNAP